MGLFSLATAPRSGGAAFRNVLIPASCPQPDVREVRPDPATKVDLAVAWPADAGTPSRYYRDLPLSSIAAPDGKAVVRGQHGIPGRTWGWCRYPGQVPVRPNRRKAPVVPQDLARSPFAYALRLAIYRLMKHREPRISPHARQPPGRISRAQPTLAAAGRNPRVTAGAARRRVTEAGPGGLRHRRR